MFLIHIFGSRTAAQVLGLTAGLACALAIVMAGRVPAGTGTLGLDVQFLLKTPGTLKAERTGAVAAGRRLRPGAADAPADGTTLVRSTAGVPLAVSVRALPSSFAVDALLHVRLTGAGTTIFDGRLGALRRGTTEFVLSVAQRRSLRVEAWLEPTAGPGYEGRVEDVVLELLDRPAGGVR